jgi:hypothetical protein
VSNYLSLLFESQGDNVAEPLEGAFATPGFRPAAIGAAAGAGAHRSWFLAGYGLEDFVTPAILRGLGLPESIEQWAGGDEDVARYFDRLLSEPEKAPRSLSPFERRAEGDVTVLTPCELDAAVLEQLEEWSSARTQPRVTLYGATALAAPRPAESDDVFRFVLPPDTNVVAAPFLTLRSARRDAAVELSLFTEADVWLRGEERPDQASDANLERLVDLAAALRVNAAGAGILHLDGRRFEADAERLRVAFGDLVERVEGGW